MLQGWNIKNDHWLIFFFVFSAQLAFFARELINAPIVTSVYNLLVYHLAILTLNPTFICFSFLYILKLMGSYIFPSPQWVKETVCKLTHTYTEEVQVRMEGERV